MHQPHLPSRATSMVPGAWWMVAVLFTFQVFSMLDRLILTILVRDIKADLLISDVQMSLVLGPAFALFYALFGVPIGWAVDRRPRRLIIFLGVFFWSTATIASGFARSYEALLLARICVGIGEAALAPAAVSLIADAFTKDRVTTALSIFSSANKIGAALAMGLGGLAIAAATTLLNEGGPILGLDQPWHLVMALVGAPGLLWAFLVFTFREPPRRANEGAGVRGAAASKIFPFLRERWQLWLAMFIAFNAITILSFALSSWMPSYLDRQFGWTPVQYGPALGLTNILSAGSLILNGWIIDLLYRRGARDIHLRFYKWLILVMLPAFLLLFYVQNPVGALICYALVQTVTVPFFVYLAAVIVMMAPGTMRGRLTAMYAASFTIIGQGLGAPLVAILTDYVFGDEAMLGASLAIVTITCIAIGLAGVQWALVQVRSANRDAQEIGAAEGGVIGAQSTTDQPATA